MSGLSAVDPVTLAQLAATLIEDLAVARAIGDGKADSARMPDGTVREIEEADRRRAALLLTLWAMSGFVEQAAGISSDELWYLYDEMNALNNNDRGDEDQNWQELVRILEISRRAGEGKSLPSLAGRTPTEDMNKHQVEIMTATWGLGRYLERRGIAPELLRFLKLTQGGIIDAKNGAINEIFQPTGKKINEIVVADCLVIGAACALVEHLVEAGEFEKARHAANSVAEQFHAAGLDADYRGGRRDPSGPKPKGRGARAGGMTGKWLERRYSRLKSIWLRPKQLDEQEGALADQARFAVQIKQQIAGMSSSDARQFVLELAATAAMPPLPPREGIP